MLLSLCVRTCIGTYIRTFIIALLHYFILFSYRKCTFRGIFLKVFCFNILLFVESTNL